MKLFKQAIAYLQNMPQHLYYIIGVLGLLIPNLFLSLSPYMTWVAGLLNLAMPMGLWLIVLALSKRPGRVILLALPLMLLINCVQLVLITVFNGAIVSVDLLLSLFSASGDEAGELLGGLILPVIIVLLVHTFLVVLAIYSWRSKEALALRRRKQGAVLGGVLLLLSLPMAAWANKLQASHTLRGDVYPLNVFYNMYIAGSKLSQLAHLDETSSQHSYDASSERSPEQREVYVFLLGETSRAFSYQLYGYPRETNPLLTARDTASMVVFRDVLTQSNTTSKSVPILLSPADAENSHRLPNVKGLLTALKEAGYHTVFISNQPENRSFLDNFAYEADEHYRIRDLIKEKRSLMDTRPVYDADMLPFLDEVLGQEHRKLFVIMHGYGQHWSYPDRYPEEFAHFKDDKAFSASPRDKERLVNAYDNAVRYNDYLLNEVIKRLERLPDAATAMYFTADHGEDIYDDARERILHSSPSISYYQLHVPAILWANEIYRHKYADVFGAAKRNATKAATSRSNFHTLLSLSGVRTKERQDSLSLMSPMYHEGLRSYLNDRYECVPISELLIDKEDLEMWQKMQLRPLK